MIFRCNRKQMIAIDHERKSYFLMDEEGMRSIGNQMSQMQEQLQNALKNLPPEQRAAAEKMMQARMGGNIAITDQTTPQPPEKVTRTGETDNINGYPCVKYVVTRGVEKVRELCVTDWANIEGGAEATDDMRSMAKFAKDLIDHAKKYPHEPQRKLLLGD